MIPPPPIPPPSTNPSVPPLPSLSRNRTKLLSTTDQTAKFLYTIIKQLDLKCVNWELVAESLAITNGHAARMRYSRFKAQIEGTVAQAKPRGRKQDVQGEGRRKTDTKRNPDGMVADEKRAEEFHKDKRFKFKPGPAQALGLNDLRTGGEGGYIKPETGADMSGITPASLPHGPFTSAYPTPALIPTPLQLPPYNFQNPPPSSPFQPFYRITPSHVLSTDFQPFQAQHIAHPVPPYPTVSMAQIQGLTPSYQSPFQMPGYDLTNVLIANNSNDMQWHLSPESRAALETPLNFDDHAFQQALLTPGVGEHAHGVVHGVAHGSVAQYLLSSDTAGNRQYGAAERVTQDMVPRTMLTDGDGAMAAGTVWSGDDMERAMNERGDTRGAGIGGVGAGRVVESQSLGEEGMDADGDTGMDERTEGAVVMVVKDEPVEC